MNNRIFCNNCGNYGHNFRDCNEPITSIGIIAYTYINGERHYLMLRRRDTLGFVDFMRGKYNVNNKNYLINIINEMTVEEKNKLVLQNFNTLWDNLWGSNISLKYMNEKLTSQNKFNILCNGVNNNDENYRLVDLINSSTTRWNDQEWGFPKGRRNYKETDIVTGIREFCEETGISKESLNIIKNTLPFEEIFTGSNFKSYKHKYYLAELDHTRVDLSNYEKSEVSELCFMNFKDCITKIRDYNLEKKILLVRINDLLDKYKILNID